MTARWEFDLMVPVGVEGIVLGRAPSDDEVLKRFDLYWIWIRLKTTDPNTLPKDLPAWAK